MRSRGTRIDPARSLGRLALAVLAVAATVAFIGCGALSGETPPSWKDSPAPAESPTAALTPDANGVFPGCPVTLAEAKAAVPEIERGPDVGVPFKNVTQNCTFTFAGPPDLLGRTLGVGILVFDAEGAGGHMWDSVRTDPSFPNATDVPGLGDVAFVTGADHFTDLWAVQGQVALHVSSLRRQGLTAEQFTALARAAFARLRP